MRDYLAHVLAAIQVPPHMPYTYFENAKNVFRNLEHYISQAGTKGEKVSERLKYFTGDRFEDPVRELPGRMWSMIRGLENSDSGYSTDSFSKMIERLQQASKNRVSLDGYLERLSDNKSDWSEYRDFVASYKEFVKEYPYFLRSLEEAEHQDPDDAQEYQQVSQELQTYRSSLDAVYKYISFYIKFAPKVRAFMVRTELRRKENSSWSAKEKNFPPHKVVDVLYHAGTDIPAILAQGFKTRAQLGEEKAALGGGPSDVISFTADIEIAKAIVDGLRDMVKIAKGELTFEDIEKLAKEEGLDPKIFDDVKQDYGRRERPPGFPDFKYTDDDRRTPKKLAFEAYRLVFLVYSQSRYNPAFFGVSVENFENVNPESIGIVAAKVQMDQATEYLQSMEEFRVPVSAILSVKRVLY